MNREKNWYDYDDGYSIGTSGAGGGAIVRDEEHKRGARITLEEESSLAEFAITCGVYGWMFHTRFFGEEEKAFDAFDEMKTELGKVLESMPDEADPGEEAEGDFAEELEMFVEKFP
jgi:hypothetical protein